jgi:Protein of unknown function (DUF3309)
VGRQLARVRDATEAHNLFVEEGKMGLIVLIIVVLLVIGALPTWPYSTGWGYYPSGGLGLILLILIILLLMGRL